MKTRFSSNARSSSPLIAPSSPAPLKNWTNFSVEHDLNRHQNIYRQRAGAWGQGVFGSHVSHGVGRGGTFQRHLPFLRSLLLHAEGCWGPSERGDVPG